MKLFKVVVRDRETDQVIHTVQGNNGDAVMPEGKAERVEDGLNINLDHEKFYTDTVEVEHG